MTLTWQIEKILSLCEDRLIKKQISRIRNDKEKVFTNNFWFEFEYCFHFPPEAKISPWWIRTSETHSYFSFLFLILWIEFLFFSFWLWQSIFQLLFFWRLWWLGWQFSFGRHFSLVTENETPRIIILIIFFSFLGHKRTVSPEPSRTNETVFVFTPFRSESNREILCFFLWFFRIPPDSKD